MQLTLYTDYSLRVLLYLELIDEAATIAEIATHFKISKNHLVKVVHNLGKRGFIKTTRGRRGGLRLAHSPKSINLAEVIQCVEPNFHFVECFNTPLNRCVITPACRLKGVLGEARDAFMGVLRQYTLADLMGDEDEMRRLLDFPPAVNDRAQASAPY